MRRTLFSLALVLATLAAAPSAHAAYSTGISDQAAATFTNPLFKPLKLTTGRYIASYDALSDPVQKQKLDDWIKGARSAKVRMLVSFEHSRTRGKERKAPTAGQYESALKKFKKAYPDVKEWSPWNEVNRCQGSKGTEGQPNAICNKTTGPKLAATYYKIARRVCGTSCKIVALDLLDENNIGPALNYIKAFRKLAKPTPKIWGIHNYSDTNRGSTARTKRLIEATKSGEIWLTETGGIVKLKTSFKYSPARAKRAIGCMFTIAKAQPRIKRLYVYQFFGAVPDEDFDAGLVAANGSTKRPGYDTVRTRKAGSCKGVLK